MGILILIRKLHTTANEGLASVKTAGLFFLCLIVTSCASQIHKLQYKGAVQGFETRVIETPVHKLTIQGRTQTKTDPVVIYIQGDGNAFRRFQVSSNPTPTSFIVPNFMYNDWSVNRIYISRPCMYHDLKSDPRCNYKVWSLERYGENTVASINHAIDLLKPTKKQKIKLVGFSGGGAIAILIAARRDDVISIKTIAANLSEKELTKDKGVTELTGYDPIDFAKKVSNIPQLHLYGDEDKTIPTWVSENFVKAANSKCVKRRLVKDATHTEGWNKVWKKVARETLDCK